MSKVHDELLIIPGNELRQGTFQYFLILIMTTMFGCNMVNEEAVKTDVLNSESGNLASLCKMDPDALKNLMSQKVTGDLNCLKDNFNQFISSVEATRPGWLNKGDIFKFIDHYYPEDARDIHKGLTSFFNINYLLLGDETDFISREQINTLLDFLILFNNRIVEVYPYFKDTSDRSDHQQETYKLLVHQAFSDIALGLENIIKLRSDKPASLDIMDVITNFMQDDDSQTLQQIKALLFIKKIFLGGKKTELTNVDTQRIVNNLPSFATAVFNLLKLGKIDFRDLESQYDFFDENLATIKKVLYYSPHSQEILFTIEDILMASREFPDDIVDLTKYPNTIFELKKILVDRKDSSQYDKYFTPLAMDKIFSHLENIIAEGKAFARFSEYYHDLLQTPVGISHPMDDYPVNDETEQNYFNHYRKVVKNYRFFKGDFTAPFYSNRFLRNPKAINEVAMIEYGLNLVLNFYGTGKDGEGRPSFKVDDITDLIKRFRDLLLDKQIIIPGREIASSENTVLLGNLFQYQSNGNPTLDLEEATEFAYTILSGISIGDYIKQELKLTCKPADGSTSERIPMDCFQHNFFPILKQKYKPYFPKLFSFIDQNINNSAAIDELIDVTAKFSRVCPDNPTLSDNDMVAVLGGLLNVESTLIRFDKSQDNILDYPELMDAFQVYKSSIESLIAKTGAPDFIKSVTKEIFLFLVKYKEVPDTKNTKSIVKFVKFIALENKKDITGNRTTIASILRNLGVIGKKDRERRGIFDPPGLCKVE